ncbi:MazG nucleotide pyrophosphohydrolase domain-containing protein [Reinekea sp. G2M2-21]|uniref:MazG nucleotide pyrophosphohydrolase domain-containing protein n=1 Tax=Reinekea sp. G2M2-21 TaxID=2788942 RepID=UPI0018AB67E6|nr:MazG nucleotide pyrophosphohydrolase domain-containing protein [Reinekea sp. G2M2-21]
MNLNDLQQHVGAVDTLPDPQSGYFLKLIEEVGELAEAIRQGQAGQPTLETLKGSIAEELVDVLYYTLALANQHGVDLQQSFDLKEQLNRIKYQR